jgi:ABC-type transport system involved in multi-copper enzyme maturation permease subunit
MTRLIRAELLKLGTTRTWWGLASGIVLGALLALIFWGTTIYAEFEAARRVGDRLTTAELDQRAAEIYTAGQFFGLMFVMLLGVLMVTNEYQHQTATATFLVTPRREQVVLAKLVTALGAGVVAWLVVTALDLGIGVFLHQVFGSPNRLDRWPVQQAILLNLLAYGLWTAIGIGIGVLLRRQTAAVVTATVVYSIGTFVAAFVVQALYTMWSQDWILVASVLVPSIASTHMTTGVDYLATVEMWPRWTGAVILLGWAVAAGATGVWIMRRRDVA